jgi:hypothetical protein
MKKIIIIFVLGFSSVAVFGQDIVNEFLNGEYYYYNSKGHSKSKGINLRIKVPKRFEKQEGNRPNIIQRFEYKADGVYAIALLIILDMGATPTSSEIDDFFEVKTISAMLNQTEGQTYLWQKKITIDGLKGVMAKTELTRSTFGIVVKGTSLTFMAIYKDKLIQFMCSLNTNQSEIDILWDKYETLFTLMANSIIIDNQWER